MPNIELTVSEGSPIELSVSSDSAVELGIAEQIISGGGGGNYQDKTVSFTPTESAQTQTVHADAGYDALDDVTVNVAAIDDEYVGSAVPRKSSSDLSASGATVTAPAGYYAAQASKTVQSGTEGTPVATKGAVSNHAISVTPSVTNAAGYISGGTKTGTAVSVSASELVSGTYTVDSSGTKDVTNYASVSIPAGTAGTPSAGKNAVQNHSISLRPLVTNAAGYISGGTVIGNLVTVDVSELVSGTKSITSNGTGIDVTEYAAVDVAVPSGSPTLQTKSVSYTPTTSSQTAQVTADQGYDGLDVVNVSVAAMPSGTAGTPTATKGTVSNHSVSVTPSVTNTTGYITGSTKTGTAVTVSASELVSGSETKTANGTYDVTNLASLVVNVSGSGVQYATGTYKPTQTYNTTGNRQICTLSDIGFTPTKFMLRVKTRADVSGIQYAVLYAEYESTWPLRITVRYSNSSNTSAASVAQSDWTTQSNYYLYFNNNTIYFRTTSQFILIGNLEYTWEAYA